jgi:hypothetical protein
MLSIPIILRPVAESKPVSVSERRGSWNLEDDTEMDLGVREMDGDEVARDTE